LFSFFWKETTETIRYYEKSVHHPADLVVGGVLATLMSEHLQREFPQITVVRGLLDKSRILDPHNELVVDELVPDYTILEHTDYQYASGNAYLGYVTRGCPNRCDFCAVPSIEPEFKHYIPLRPTIETIESEVGPKKDLLLLDNNVLASKDFPRIIDEIKKIGFQRGALLGKAQRSVDFNQGMDMRLFDDTRMSLLSGIAIRPLRLAFDEFRWKTRYIKTVELAAKHGILQLSTYVLYNYKDTPEDFYKRLLTGVELNERLGTKIYGFPMKYIPVMETDRIKFIGKHWTWKMIRGVQCILNATRGLVTPRKEFFEAAFGRSPAEFVKIINMPDRYILSRVKHQGNGASEWGALYDSLDKSDMSVFLDSIASNRFRDMSPTGIPLVDRLLKHYEEAP
jgi:hypothetical protein